MQLWEVGLHLVGQFLHRTHTIQGVTEQAHIATPVPTNLLDGIDMKGIEGCLFCPHRFTSLACDVAKETEDQLSDPIENFIPLYSDEA